MSRGFWTEERKQIIRSRYPSEGAILALELGISKSSLFAQASRLGVRTEVTRHESRARNLTTVDIHFFERWSAEMAYVLGYIWADGSIHGDKNKHPRTLTFYCWAVDEDIITQVRKFLRSSHKLVKRPGGIRKDGVRVSPYIKCSISSTCLVRSLQHHGLEPNKSAKDLKSGEIPHDMLPHFVRGYLDGDGWVISGPEKWKRVCGLAGTPNFIQDLRDKIVSAVGIQSLKLYTPKKKPKLRRIAWTAKSDLRKLYHWLYPPGVFSGNRKKSKFQEIVAKL